MGLFGKWKPDLGNIASSLGAAAAYGRGDSAEATDILEAQYKRRALKQKEEQELAQRRAVMERLVASGMSPEDAMILASDETAIRQVIGQKYEKPTPPALQQNFEWWKGLPDTEKQQFGRYQDTVNPQWRMGADDIPRLMPRGQGGGGPQPGHVEDGYQFMGGDPADPNSWKQVGGGGGNATGGFRYPR